MPKKKKKSRPSTDSGPPTTPQAREKAEISQVRVNEDETLVSCISLKLVGGGSLSGGSSGSGDTSNNHGRNKLQYTPRVVMNEIDAKRIAVSKGDEVFIISEAQTDTLIAAVARVDILHASRSTPSKVFSTSPKSSASKSKIAGGSSQVFPLSISRQLGGSSEQQPSNLEHVTPVSVSKELTPDQNHRTNVSTPSSSKSKFSFAKGGGGDAIINSSSPGLVTPPRHRVDSTAKSSVQIFVVPMNSDLGAKIEKILCCEAKNLVVSNEEGVFESCGTLGQRLVLAHMVGSYVSVGASMTISFGGKQTECIISRASGTVDKREMILSGAFGALSIDDETSIESTLLKTLSVKDPDRIPQLYYISNNTKISFENDEHEAPVTAASQPKKRLVAGMDDTVANVKSLLLSPLLRPHLYPESLGPPRGILLHGPSGTGKSCLAKQLSFTLGEHAHVQFIECTSLQSLTAIAGQAEERLSQIFQAAHEFREDKKGGIIIMDDIHLICPHRRGVNIASDRLAATLLALMDGIPAQSTGKVHQPVMVFAITSTPSSLDSAMRRAGRLDTEVEVPLPDEPATRVDIMKFQLESHGMIDTFNSTQWLALGRSAKGFTGADCALAVKDAIRMSILKSPRGEVTKETIFSMEDMEISIRSIKPSAIKAVSVEIPQVPWSSIGGMESVKRQLQEAIEIPLIHAEMFQKMRIRPPRGILLYGPPGCSKTLMARALATESQMNFLAVKGPELLSKWLGESERALASLFRRARLASPSIIFFDEIDAIATKRGSTGSGGGERLLSQLLTELDGVQTGRGDPNKQKVIVVCATNRPDLLDSALMRPGRIDKMIYVGIPGPITRSGIFELCLKGRSTTDDIDIGVLASDDVSGGLSGAEVVASCRNAALLALEENDSGSPSISMQNVLRAVNEMERQITPDMIKFYEEYHNGSSQ